MKIPKADIEQIRSKIDMVSFLEKRGIRFSKNTASLVALCPLHNEKSGSFHIKPHQSTYHCFGCGKGGDIFNLVQELEGLSFVGAVNFLAEEAGVTLSQQTEDEDYKQKQRLYKICDIASKWYRENFKALPPTHPAKENLAARKLLELSEKDETIGFAPNSGLLDLLISKKFTMTEIAAVGLVSLSEDGNKSYEMFRNRLMWTVNDISGKPVGFSGRIIKEGDNPKYLNSPGTQLYIKSRILLGLDSAKREITKQQKVYVVEGATDIMAFKATGIENVVATCGTAFGTEHASLLMHLAEMGRESNHFKIIFCFDGDNAGLQAAKKVFAKNKQIQLQSYVVKFETGDPCDIRLAEGDNGLLNKISESETSIVEFILLEERSQWDLRKPEGQSGFVKVAKEILSDITDPIQYAAYLRKISHWTGIQYIDLARTASPSKQTIDNQTVKQEISIYEKVIASILQYPDEMAELIKDYQIDETYFADFGNLFTLVVEGQANQSLDHNNLDISRLSHHSLNIDENRKKDILLSLTKSLLKYLYNIEMNQINAKMDMGESADISLLIPQILEEQARIKKKYFI